MTVTVAACEAFRYKISEAKVDIIRLQTKNGDSVSFNGPTCGYGGAISTSRDLSVQETRRLQRAWACLKRFTMGTYDRSGVRLRLKMRLLKAEVLETAMHGCVTWSPEPVNYPWSRKIHHSIPLRSARRQPLILRRRPHQDRFGANRGNGAQTGMLFAAFNARMGQERLQGRIMFRAMVRSKNYSLGPHEYWTGRLEANLNVIGIRPVRWCEAARNVGWWVRVVEDGAKAFMRK